MLSFLSIIAQYNIFLFFLLFISIFIFQKLNSFIFRFVSSLEAFNYKQMRVSFSPMTFQSSELPITQINGSSRTELNYYQNYFL
jgi:hypothetical protein